MTYFRKFANTHHALVSIGITELEEYTTRMEEELGSQVTSFNVWFEEQSKDMSEDDKNEFGDYYSDEYHTIASTNPTLFRSSTVITIFSFLERHMKRLCRYLERKLMLSRSLPKKAYIHHCRDYLIDLANMRSFFDDSTEWELLNGIYREIRNAFAHNQGEVSEDKIAFIQEGLATLNGSVNNIDEITLEKEFCFEFIRHVRDFFDSLFNNLNPDFFRPRSK